MGRRKIEIDMDKLSHLIEKGYNKMQLAEEFNISTKTVARILKDYNLLTKEIHEDLVGKKFGKLTVIKRLENTIERRRVYLCKCECGNTTKVKAKYLNRGDTRSCGCYKKDFSKYEEKNYKEALTKIGEKYGKLTIIDIEKDENKKKYMMICRCECGNISKKFYSDIKNGEIVSCGCFSKEEASKRMTGICTYNLYKYGRWYFIKNGEKIFCRSGYEVIYANFLMINNIEFEYEPETFKLDNGKRYTPDFYLIDEGRYIEIKGVDYSIRDKGNQRERFEMFRKDHDIDIYYWEDLYEICNLNFKHYSSMLTKGKNMGIKGEDYLGKMLYLLV